VPEKEALARAHEALAVAAGAGAGQ
jgi:hypothetical protein